MCLIFGSFSYMQSFQNQVHATNIDDLFSAIGDDIWEKRFVTRDSVLAAYTEILWKSKES